MTHHPSGLVTVTVAAWAGGQSRFSAWPGPPAIERRQYIATFTSSDSDLSSWMTH
jgi:hypothetical protein